MIELKQISKQFGDHQVLDRLSLTVANGEIVFVIGKSGTGKSVLLKSIVGLLHLDTGEIYIDGDEVSELDEAGYLAVRLKCGLVFQAPALLDSLNVRENIAFGLRAHRRFSSERDLLAQVERGLAEVGLKREWLERHPNELSFGMQKRVSLARTLALSPQYILYDEPTTGLDPVATRSINYLIRDLAKQRGVTSIVVSHDMECALEIADRIILLEAGKIAVQGTGSELQKSEHPLARAFLAVSTELTGRET